MTATSAGELARARALLGAELRESDFQAEVISAAQLLGWAVYHTRDSRGSHPGWPDVALCKPPRLLLLELKTERGTVTEPQGAWVERLNRCSTVEALVARPSMWDQIEAVLKGAPVAP